jgi:heme A synthase
MTAPSPAYRSVACGDDRSDSPLRGLRRLTLATLLLTFVLIVIGGIVRVSDSGLGCGPGGSGFHGWPFCNGDVVPGVDLNSIVEYSHRVTASLVGLMMLALAVLVWRNHREHRALVRVSIAGFLLVVAQGALGGIVVEENLEEELVAAHLCLAMLLLAVLVWMWRATRPELIGSDPPDGGRGYRPLAIVASALVLCTIVAGGYMAGTQKYGRPDYQLGDGAHHACGKEFPTCNGEFMPFGRARLVDIHLTHRLFMYLAVLAVLALVAVTLRRRPDAGLVRGAWIALGILLLQVLVGALNVWLDEYETLIVLHLALGTLLWWTVVSMTLSLYRVPSPALVGGPAREPGPAPA